MYFSETETKITINLLHSPFGYAGRGNKLLCKNSGNQAE